jgi:signal transduction histidine kinase
MALQAVSGHDVRRDESMNNHDSLRTADPSKLNGRASQPHLLLLCVEDNEADYRLLTEHMREWDSPPQPKLTRVKTLQQALEMIDGTNVGTFFDAVLLDLTLPDSKGEETFARLHKAHPHLAVIILSGNNDRELSLQMVQQGAQDYLSKDALNGELLVRSILYAVKRQRQRTELMLLNERLRKTTEELLSAQMQLIQAEKLESLGRIAAGVAHEVKNPLGILQMGVDYLDNHRDALGKTGQIVLENMQDAIVRADTIIREMVDFSRSDEFEMKPCSANDLAERAIRMVQHEITKRRVLLEKDLASALPMVHADQAKLEQVLLNVLMNALQAMPAGGTMIIRTSLAKVDETRRDQGLREFNEMRRGADIVVMEVRDQGPGIPAELLSRVLEPFFTTKPTGEGTGLGLSVVKRIVELHRGSLELQNMADPSGLSVRIALRALDQTSSDHTMAETPLTHLPASNHKP